LFEFGLRHMIAGLAADLPIDQPEISTRRREGAKRAASLRVSASSR
jgi:hypothetical protein